MNTTSSNIENSIIISETRTILNTVSTTYNGEILMVGKSIFTIISGSPTFSSTLIIGSGTTLIISDEALILNGKTIISGNFNYNFGMIEDKGEIIVSGGILLINGLFSIFNIYKFIRVYFNYRKFTNIWINIINWIKKYIIK